MIAELTRIISTFGNLHSVRSRLMSDSEHIGFVREKSKALNHSIDVDVDVYVYVR